MPDRFDGAEHAREVFRGVFGWYNNEHHNSGIVYLTPSVVHQGAPTRSSTGGISPAWLPT